LLFLKRTKTKVNMVKVEAEVKLLSAELGRGGEGKLRVEAGLSDSVESYDV
jgi:hypothetical protein